MSVTADDHLRLTVRDDGNGFDPARAGNGQGVVGMRDRAEAVGGHLTVHTVPTGGTQVRAELPLEVGHHDPSGR